MTGEFADVDVPLLAFRKTGAAWLRLFDDPDFADMEGTISPGEALALNRRGLIRPAGRSPLRCELTWLGRKRLDDLLAGRPHLRDHSE